MSLGQLDTGCSLVLVFEWALVRGLASASLWVLEWMLDMVFVWALECSWVQAFALDTGCALGAPALE